MGAVSQTVIEAPAGVSLRARAVAAAVILVVTAFAGFLIGAARGDGPPGGATVLRDGVPVGVLHTRAGALAAADHYLVADLQTIERAPDLYAVLVREAFASDVQPSALAQAASLRESDSAGMTLWAAGGHSLTLIGGHRLERYRLGRPVVTAWVGTVYWGPGQPPKQAWSLARLALIWTGGRWRVTGLVTTSAQPAPVPARTPQAAPATDNTRLFDSSLAGFTSVDSGAPAP
jgi:hypothetical protein